MGLERSGALRASLLRASGWLSALRSDRGLGTFFAARLLANALHSSTEPRNEEKHQKTSTKYKHIYIYIYIHIYMYMHLDIFLCKIDVYQHDMYIYMSSFLLQELRFEMKELLPQLLPLSALRDAALQGMLQLLAQWAHACPPAAEANISIIIYHQFTIIIFIYTIIELNRYISYIIIYNNKIKCLK